MGGAGPSAAVELLVRNTTLAQGHRVPDHAVPDPGEGIYYLDCVNADVELRTLGENLRRAASSCMGLLAAARPPTPNGLPTPWRSRSM
jgi:hypothetical protein